MREQDEEEDAESTGGGASFSSGGLRGVEQTLMYDPPALTNGYGHHHQQHDGRGLTGGMAGGADRSPKAFRTQDANSSPM